MKCVLSSIVLVINFCFAQSGNQSSIFLETHQSEILENLIQPPAGYERIPVVSNSFGAWLRHLPVLPDHSPVKDYKNRIFKEANDSNVAAVVAYDIKGRNLDQCMDILIRFHSQFLMENDKANEIQYPLPDGLILSWKDWSGGMRPYFKGLHFYIAKTAIPDSSYKNLLRYQNTLFEYSGTQAFYHYYKTIPLSEIRIGDFVVKKGAHGHAVMIVDLAKNAEGNMLALVGQGDSPACQFYLLSNSDSNPWFPVNLNDTELKLPIKKRMYWLGLRRFGAE